MTNKEKDYKTEYRANSCKSETVIRTISMPNFPEIYSILFEGIEYRNSSYVDVDKSGLRTQKLHRVTGIK